MTHLATRHRWSQRSNGPTITQPTLTRTKDEQTRTISQSGDQHTDIHRHIDGAQLCILRVPNGRSQPRTRTQGATTGGSGEQSRGKKYKPCIEITAAVCYNNKKGWSTMEERKETREQEVNINTNNQKNQEKKETYKHDRGKYNDVIRFVPNSREGEAVLDGICISTPSRITLASGADNCFRLFKDCSAFKVCTVPRIAFIVITTKITIINNINIVIY